MGRDLIQILQLHSRVPRLFRVEHDVRPLRAGPEAHVGLYFHICASRLGGPLLELRQKKFGASIFTVDVLTDQKVAGRTTHRLLITELRNLDPDNPVFFFENFLKDLPVLRSRQYLTQVLLKLLRGQKLSSHRVRLPRKLTNRAVETGVGNDELGLPLWDELVQGCDNR